MTRDVEVALAGGGLASLAAGALLARAGRTVAVVAPGEVSVRRAGYTFDLAPCPPWGLGPGGAWHHIFTTLGRPLAAEPIRPAPQLLWPGHRLTLWSDRDRLGREMDREAPGERPRLEAILAALDRAAAPAGLRDRWLARQPVDRLLRRLEAGPAGWLMISAGLAALGIPPGAGAGRAAWALAILRGGLGDPPGGLSGLGDYLSEALVRAGGLLLREEPLVAVQRGPGGCVAAETRGGATITCRLLVDARPGPGDPPARVLLMGAEELAVPSELGPFSLLAAAPVAGDRGAATAALSTSPPGDVRRAPPGRRALVLWANGPGSPDDLAALLERLAPGLNRHLDHREVLEVPAPPRGARVIRARSGVGSALLGSPLRFRIVQVAAWGPGAEAEIALRVVEGTIRLRSWS